MPLTRAAILVVIAGMLLGVATQNASSSTTSKPADKTITMQLNKLSQVGGACRMAFVFRNGLGHNIDDIAMEVVIFDVNGEVGKLLAIAPGRLTDGKTRMKQYDVKETVCSAVGRLLINDISRCKGDGIDAQTCLDALTPSSRINIELIK